MTMPEPLSGSTNPAGRIRTSAPVSGLVTFFPINSFPDISEPKATLRSVKVSFSYASLDTTQLSPLTVQST
ncbi:MAG: hypothetical protein BWY13_01118 [Euryarchaeota archaeon ADurb.Bin190]|nr:MAG: hypothetical protein BWY13_01118 [Euryarchaeota archaeon ADurb.Bin190]